MDKQIRPRFEDYFTLGRAHMQYDLTFAKKLIEAATVLTSDDPAPEENRRALLYLSLLSIEISLKYLLETAGVPVEKIRKHSHSIENLLTEIDGCEISVTINGITPEFVSAGRVRERIVSPMYAGATVGSLLLAESKGASTYPNEVRYGAPPQHFPPNLMFDCAVIVLEQARIYGKSIRVKANN